MLAVIIPVNRLDRAKGRLDGLLSPPERRALALATLDTVVEAVHGARLRPLVLTTDPEVATHIADRAEILDEAPELSGLSPQLERAIAGRDEVLVLHADLPLASPEAIAEFVEAAPPAPSITLVRSGDGGTNAMLIRPAGAIPLAYGRDSYAKHRAAAEASSVPVVTVVSADLELDLDTPTDIAALFATPGWEHTHAGRLLSSWGIPGRIAGIGRSA